MMFFFHLFLQQKINLTQLYRFASHFQKILILRSERGGSSLFLEKNFQNRFFLSCLLAIIEYNETIYLNKIQMIAALFWCFLILIFWCYIIYNQHQKKVIFSKWNYIGLLGFSIYPILADIILLTEDYLNLPYGFRLQYLRIFCIFIAMLHLYILHK